MSEFTYSQAVRSKVPLRELSEYCSSRGLEFKVTMTPNQSLHFHFGEIVWQKHLESDFTVKDFMRVSARVAAKYGISDAD